MDLQCAVNISTTSEGWDVVRPFAEASLIGILTDGARRRKCVVGRSFELAWWSKPESRRSCRHSALASLYLALARLTSVDGRAPRLCAIRVANHWVFRAARRFVLYFRWLWWHCLSFDRIRRSHPVHLAPALESGLSLSSSRSIWASVWIAVLMFGLSRSSRGSLHSFGLVGDAGAIPVVSVVE